jgi:kynurenine/2-aminoadipate aminotransferase
MPLLKIPGMISLGGGLPHPSSFPFKAMSVELSCGTKLDVAAEELSESLQYSPTPGVGSLVTLLKTMMAREHGLSSADSGTWDLCVTGGSQDGLTKAFDMVISEGDNVLVETPTYSGALAYLQPMGCNLVGVRADTAGMVPEELAKILNGWDEAVSGAKPKVMYTIPIGSNPSGGSLDIERKRAIYELACEHDILILEDDPYYYLQLDVTAEERMASPSYLSIDQTEALAAGDGAGGECARGGRVLRFDSFSKLLTAGFRVGFVTGPTDLVDRLMLHTQASNLHTSGISQVLVARLLGHWEERKAAGEDAFEAHVTNVTAFYRSQRDAFIESAARHLDGLVEYDSPSAGMFVWSIDRLYSPPINRLSAGTFVWSIDRLYSPPINRLYSLQACSCGWT